MVVQHWGSQSIIAHGPQLTTDFKCTFLRPRALNAHAPNVPYVLVGVMIDVDPQWLCALSPRVGSRLPPAVQPPVPPPLQSHTFTILSNVTRSSASLVTQYHQGLWSNYPRGSCRAFLKGLQKWSSSVGRIPRVSVSPPTALATQQKAFDQIVQDCSRQT